MTTIKGVIRSYGAAVRRAERVQQQHNRDAAKRYKLQLKSQELLSASKAEEDYKSYINVLKTVHKDYSSPISWNEILNTVRPIMPERTKQNEERIQWQINNFKPSFFDKMFGLTIKKMSKLNAALNQAKEYDTSLFNKKKAEYKEDVADYDKLHAIAAGVLNKNLNSYEDALEYFAPFEDLTELSKHLKFKLNANYIEVEMEVLSYDFIPGHELNLTATGKLSRKNMSTSKYHELFQEHICSSIMRIAKEILIYFPVNYVSVTVIVNELDTATGHHVNNIKLSVLIPIAKMEDIVLEAINPVECIKSFVHNMKFAKITGFGNVSKIDMTNNLLSN